MGKNILEENASGDDMEKWVFTIFRSWMPWKGEKRKKIKLLGDRVVVCLTCGFMVILISLTVVVIVHFGLSFFLFV